MANGLRSEKFAGRLREQYQELMQTALQEMRIHYELKMQQNIFKRSHYVYCKGESDNNLNNLIMCVDDRLICCGYHSKLIEISQMNSINKIVKTFGLSDCNARLVPADPFTRHSSNMINDEQLWQPYIEAIGSLMFAAIGTRPDISFAVCEILQKRIGMQ